MSNLSFHLRKIEKKIETKARKNITKQNGEQKF